MSSPEIIIIVAMAKNRVIGKDNMIPWHIPEDLHHFKATTMGHAIIMGRKTWESIGRPLPGRTNIIVSRTRQTLPKEYQAATSLTQAIQCAAGHKKIFIIGGGEMYRGALLLARSIQITLLHRTIQGDIFFPPLPDNLFVLKCQTEQHWTETVTLQHYSRINSSK